MEKSNQGLAGYAAVTKMKITNLDTNQSFYVMYNPQSFELSKGANYRDMSGINTNTPSLQFVNGQAERLSMELFFDTYSSGSEIGGTASEKKEMGRNAEKSSKEKSDVRQFTNKIYNLMFVQASTHAPPLLKLSWGSLQFTCHMLSCAQRFTKFNEAGYPVRAVLSVTFQKYVPPSKAAEKDPLESPDTAKYRTVQEGDSLWAFSAKEYGTCDQWRKIAAANEISNPRLLDTGESIAVPAL